MNQVRHNRLQQSYSKVLLAVGNESEPKIIINDMMNLFFKTAVSILVISNHNGFRVLFVKIASVYFV